MSSSSDNGLITALPATPFGATGSAVAGQLFGWKVRACFSVATRTSRASFSR